MKNALIRADFNPFTITDRTVILEYLKKYSHIFIDTTDNDYDKRKIIELSIKNYRRLHIYDGEDNLEIVYDDRLGKGLSRSDFYELDKNAAAYVLSEVLYIDSIAKSILSEYRYHHVCCVADLSADLAEHYGIGYNRGKLAGYLHDITKEWDKEKQNKVTLSYFPKQAANSPKIYHQFTARIAAQSVFQVRDKEILEAIGYHTTGDSSKLLSMIVYCADKVDDSRGFDNRAIKELCFKDIKEAFRQIKAEQLAYLKEQGING